MNRNYSAFLIAVVVIISGCVTLPPEMTPLEIQSMQTRSYESGKAVVFPSVISVFQDLGYTIQNADLSTGLISGESAAKDDGFTLFWTGTAVVDQVRATAFVEQIRDQTNVRLSFVQTRESSSEHGQRKRNDTPILDANVYQNAFERIENAIFIRSSD